MPRLVPLRLPLFLFCALLGARSARAQQPTEVPSIRVNVERVNVGVTVADSHGQFVSGLQRSDFRLFDNGAEQPITDFLSIDEPAQVLLLVEAGPAVYLLQEGHLQAVQVLLEGLAPADRVAIVRYDQTPETILSFMTDKRVAAGVLDQLRFNVGFGQLNLAASLSTVLDWLSRVPGKKSVVLLCTGVDTSAPTAIQNLLSRLQTTDVHVLPVSLTGDVRDLGASSKKGAKKNQPPDAKAQFAAEGIAQANEELNAIANANGSHAYFPSTTKDFAQVFSEISQLIRHEYSLGFLPPAHDGKVHSLEVRLASDPRPFPSAASPATSAPAPASTIIPTSASIPASPTTPASSTSKSASASAPPTAAAAATPTPQSRLDYRKAYLAPPPQQP
jgi:VWFA-related protein